MADVNSDSRKRRSPSMEVVIKLNGEDAFHQQSPSIENADPQAKVAKKDDLIEDSDSNLYHDLSQNSVETNLSVQEKILELQEENKKLKLQLQDMNNKLCKCSLKPDKEIENVPDGQDTPVITIKFLNKNTADLYRSKFKSFLESLTELTLKHEDLEINVVRRSNINELVQPDTSPDTNKSKRKRKKSKTEGAKDLFVLDTTPSLTTKGSGNLKYTSKYTVPTNIADIKDEEISSKEICSQTCFNCEGNHSVRDCLEPKDFTKINAARQKLKFQNTKVRYHLEEDQKYSHLLPGKISQNLKTALGICNNQLPEYIYRMRVIGYPPGWMEEAQVMHSDISLYDIEGKNISCSKRNKQGSVNPDKVVEYIGFNMPIQKDTKDDYERYRCPPYSDKCSKFAMLDYINKMEEKEKDNLEACDMEIDLQTDEEIVPPGCELLEEKLSARLSPSLVELEKKKLELLAALDENATNSSSGGDENLNNIAKQINLVKNDDIKRATVEKSKIENEKDDSQNQLLSNDPVDGDAIETRSASILQTAESEQEDIKQEVTEINSSQQTRENETKISNNVSNEMKIESVEVEDTSKIEEAVQIFEAQIQEMLDANDVTFIDSSPRTPTNNVKKSSLGTPIIKSASPFTTLPSPEKFSKGVSPIINFENLPNSTGKYEQMSGVIFKVRRTLKNITDRS